jgi:hypothetical protein
MTSTKKLNIKANILIMVLFVLIVTALFWLILSQQARSMLSTVSNISNYYKTYYLAYGGVQVWFAHQSSHGYWYEDVLSLKNWEEETTNIAINIQSRQTMIHQDTISNICTDQTMYSIRPGDAYIVPLFFDEAKWFNTQSYSSISSSELRSEYAPKLISKGVANDTIVIRIVDEQLQNYNAQRMHTLKWQEETIPLSFIEYTANNPENKAYLIIANPNANSISICIQSNKPLVNSYIQISSTASYHDTQVTLFGKKQFQVPGFLTFWTIQ